MRRSLAVLAALSLAPGLVAGQVLPGTRARERGSIRAEFLDAVRQGVRAASTQWTEAWSRGDASAAAVLYHEEAFLLAPDGREVRGSDVVLAYLREALRHAAPLETFLVDVDASNNMAMTIERFVLRAPAPDGSERRGLLFTV